MSIFALWHKKENNAILNADKYIYKKHWKQNKSE